MNYFSSFSFSFRYYTFLLSHKIDLIRLRYPLLYTLIYNSFFIIFTILLHTYLDPPHSLLCQPDTDSSVQDFTVGEETTCFTFTQPTDVHNTTSNHNVAFHNFTNTVRRRFF